MNRVRTILPACILLLILSISLMPITGPAVGGQAAGKKVLVVASYHPDYKWVEDIITSLERNLPGAEFTMFYMDTKRNLAGAAAKAEEAYRLYQDLKPDAVITIDDNAQEYFVVPYLKDKVITPVIFCGVNDDATKFGFPASNVTGVLEKKHYRESISFAQVLKPGIHKVGVLYKPSPSNKVNVGQILNEQKLYSATLVPPVAVTTLDEALQAARDMEGKADAVILLNMTGITDSAGKNIEGHDAIRAITDRTSMVTIGASDWEVEAGALCGVIKAGEEQGSLAADLLLAHWAGWPVSELPITQNRNGQRFINLKTLKHLEIELTPEMIMGTKIISGK